MVLAVRVSLRAVVRESSFPFPFAFPSLELVLIPARLNALLTIPAADRPSCRGCTPAPWLTGGVMSVGSACDGDGCSASASTSTSRTGTLDFLRMTRLKISKPEFYTISTGRLLSEGRWGLLTKRVDVTSDCEKVFIAIYADIKVGGRWRMKRLCKWRNAMFMQTYS